MYLTAPSHYQSQCLLIIIHQIPRNTTLIYQIVSDGEDDEFFSPEFMKRPKGALVDEGTSILFSCQIVANPMPRVVWEKDGEQIKDTPGRFVVSDCELEWSHICLYFRMDIINLYS